MGRPILTEPGRVVPGSKHGTMTGYTGHNCRCLECRRANREWYAEKRRQTKARIAELEAALAAK